MEVSHLTQYDTHAVIGGGKAESFSMSASAEFFTVLSDTMYSNKKLAVVREVMCNAWDSHIVAGKKNVPIQVTITNDEMSIEDFGTGIPNDKIVGVYCVYGASTKAKDDNQTGGFGLGSKAPFAYAAHFTVTNSIDGVKTIYAASRGSSETEGRPDFRVIARIPTQDTGIKVTIPIASKEDSAQFVTLAKKIAMNGSMNVVLNESQVNVFDATEAEKLGFVLTRYEQTLSLDSKISIRYGSVIYPLDPTNEGIRDAMARIAKMIGEFNILFFAPAGKIGVTPSRESLSYTEITRVTVNNLIEAAIKKINGEGRVKARKLLVDAIMKKATNLKGEITEDSVLKVASFSPQDSLISVRSATDIAVIGAIVHTWNDRDFCKSVAKLAMRAMIEKLPSYRSVIRKVIGLSRNLHPGVRKCDVGANGYIRQWKMEFFWFNELMKQEKLRRNLKWMHRIVAESGAVSSAIAVSGNSYLSSAPFARQPLEDFSDRKQIFISSTIGDLARAVDEATHGNQYALCFRIGKTKTELRRKVIVVADRLGVEVVQEEPRKIERKPKPKVEFLSLAAFCTSGSFSKSTRIVEMEEIRKKFSVEKPAYYLYGVTRDSTVYMSDEHDFQYMMPLVHRLYPEAALATSAFVRDKMIAVGSKSVTEMMIEEVRKHIDNKAVQYGFFIENASCSHFYPALNVTGSALDWAKRDARIAQLFFPMRLVNAEKVNRIKDILRCLAVIKTDEVIKLKDDLSEKTKNLFSIQDFNKTILTKFPGISMMEKTTFENNKADPDALYETLVFMKKRGEKLAAAQKEK